jgi:hypothetical protein
MTDTLNPDQRAALQAAVARRAKSARLEHYRRQAELAATPDYFQWAEHAARFVRDVRMFAAARRRNDELITLADAPGMDYFTWRSCAA